MLRAFFLLLPLVACNQRLLVMISGHDLPSPPPSMCSGLPPLRLGWCGGPPHRHAWLDGHALAIGPLAQPFHVRSVAARSVLALSRQPRSLSSRFLGYLRFKGPLPRRFGLLSMGFRPLSFRLPVLRLGPLRGRLLLAFAALVAFVLLVADSLLVIILSLLSSLLLLFLGAFVLLGLVFFFEPLLLFLGRVFLFLFLLWLLFLLPLVLWLV